MQTDTGIRAKPYNVAGVGRNFRFEQNQVEHKAPGIAMHSVASRYLRPQRRRKCAGDWSIGGMDYLRAA